VKYVLIISVSASIHYSYGDWAKHIWSYKRVYTTASGTESGTAGVFTRATQLYAPRSSTSADPATQSSCETLLHAPLFISDRFPSPVFRSRGNSVEQQIWICIVIGCRSQGVEENRACRIGSLALGRRQLTPTLRPFLAQFWSTDRTVAVGVISTLKIRINGALRGAFVIEAICNHYQ